MLGRERRRRAGLGDSAGRAALYPARIAARAWRGRIEAAADDVLSAPEIARLVDGVLAGPLPEQLAQSLVRHRVIERVVRELAASGELERLLQQSLASPRTAELTDQVLASPEMQQALQRVAASPELRRAVARQSASLAEEVVAGLRAAATRLDRRIGRTVSPAYAGIPTRGAALAIDSLVALAIFASTSAVLALIASLVGGIQPAWLAGSLLAVGWVLIAGGYFVLFWSAAGQTPGMRLLRLRVRRADGGDLSALRAAVRVVGLALAIIPLFAGFLPALVDRRRRALPDYLAGSVVVYEDTGVHPDELGGG